MRFVSVCLAVVFVVCLLAPLAGIAAVPPEMNFQGILTDSNGDPAATGTYYIRFRIYDASEGGTVVWESDNAGEVYVPVNVEDGLYNYLVGSHGSLPPAMAAHDSLWLGVKMGPGEPEMTPRSELVSVMYSLRSSFADLSGNSELLDGLEGTEVEESAEIDADITAHATQSAAHHEKTIDASELVSGSLSNDLYSAYDDLTAEAKIGTQADQIAPGVHGHAGFSVPIGGIVAWLKSFPNTPALPDGFEECNGQVLSDPQSAYDGLTLPDLNGTGSEFKRFLRGSSTSGTTGGAEGHRHNLEAHNWGCCSNTMDPVAWTEHLPPFYEVVWVMRVR